MDLVFEWDSRKAIRNHNKHGVSFTQASSLKKVNEIDEDDTPSGIVR